MKPKVIVIGAGVAGLSAALHLAETAEFDVELFEKTDRLGGLATSFQLGPAVFDFGPHAFHSQEPEIINFFTRLMGSDYYEINKHVAIKFQEMLYSYPLNPLKALRNMPVSMSVKCGLSYFKNLLEKKIPLDKLETSEQFFIQNYGREFYRVFFEGYTKKVWGIHPRDLSAKFMRNRVPSANALKLLLMTLTGSDIKIKKPNEVTYRLRIFYPKKGSIQFPNKMGIELQKKEGIIHLSSQLSAVELSHGKVSAVVLNEGGKETRHPCDYLISTIPLPELIDCLRPLPAPELLSSSSALFFRPIVIACLWIKKDKIFDYQTIYYTNRIFNRLAQMNSYSPETVPAGTTGITAEITCKPGDDLWNMSEKNLLNEVVKDMKIEGLIKDDDVIDGMVLRHMKGYPIYRIGFEKDLFALASYIGDISNLFSSGRQGMFSYAQMHFGVGSGMMIKDHIMQGKRKPTITIDSLGDLRFC